MTHLRGISLVLWSIPTELHRFPWSPQGFPQQLCLSELPQNPLNTAFNFFSPHSKSHLLREKFHQPWLLKVSSKGGSYHRKHFRTIFVSFYHSNFASSTWSDLSSGRNTKLRSWRGDWNLSFLQVNKYIKKWTYMQNASYYFWLGWQEVIIKLNWQKQC